MKPIRLLIAEDEIPQQDNLISLLKPHESRIEIVGTASNGNDALQLIKNADAGSCFS